MNAESLASSAAIRRRCASTTSTGDTSFALISRARSIIEAQTRSVIRKLGGGLCPPSEISPQDSIARAKPALEAEHRAVGYQPRAPRGVSPARSLEHAVVR